ncbi:MAG: TAXI family TRAP transporter solute-binding subunit, partial [Oscillospiraceae bacterium]|nr:TAXI family TRAP transporter solute-binding subunit [Oscillospiraceae bacterium]
MKKLLTLVSAVALCVAMLLTSCQSGSTKIKVGTGGPTGTYYAYTNAVGSILQGETGLAFDVVSTGGSVANINGIDDGDYTMAIVQNDTMINAYNDLDKVNFKNGAVKSFSVLGEVYSEVVQIVVDGSLKDKVKTLADLRGMRVSVGDAGSGVYLNAKDLFAAYDMDIDKDIQQNNLSVGDSANAMKDGQ